MLNEQAAFSVTVPQTCPTLHAAAVPQKYLGQVGAGDNGCSDSLSAPSGRGVAPQCFQSLHPRAVSSRQDVPQQFFTTSLSQALVGS